MIAPTNPKTPMKFDKQLFNDHLRNANVANNPYDLFDTLWKAFNVYYESLFKEERGREIARIHLSVSVLEKSDYTKFLTPETVSPLNTIPLVFSERDWRRRSTKDTSSHEVANSALTSIRNGAVPTQHQLIAILTLMYVIRCNIAHGFKTRDDSRDIEVLSAANSIFVPFMKTLAGRVL